MGKSPNIRPGIWSFKCMGCTTESLYKLIVSILYQYKKDSIGMDHNIELN